MLEKMISQHRAMCWSRWLFTLCLLGFFTGSAFAQGTFQLLVQRGPYYVGEPVVVQVAAKFTDDSGNKPDCRFVGDAQAGLQVSGPRVSQSISRYMQSSGGRTTSQEISNFKFTFAAIASKAGRFSIGPFEVDYGGSKKTVEGTTLEFEQLDNDEDMLLEVSLPGDTFFVGQRVPVTIKWGCSAPIYDVQFAFQNLQIQSPLFDQFSFDDKEARTQTSLTIRSATGEEVSIDAKQSTEMRGGREFVVLTSQRTMIVDAVGNFEMLPITCHTKRGSGWRKDLFGRARPSSTRPAFTSGEPVDFAVKTLPTEGRPDSFAGAVGDGYAIDVSANRSVVRVGDPISLTVDLRGPGLERMSLPDLSKDGGMDPQLFQIPKEQPSGTYNGRTKQFKVSVRVKDESVEQFPALAFSWFDPYKAQYFTTRSKPIALQVMPAQVVSATDVIAAASTRQESEVAGSGSDSVGNTSRKVPTSSVALLAQGANLAIEQDPSKLLARSTNAFFGKLISWGSYGLGLAAIATAFLVRRRGDIDPEVAQQRQRRRAWRKQISDAGDLSGKASAEQIAGGLRQLQATVDTVDRAKLNELIRECENAIYAPSEANADTRDLVNRALQVVDSIKAAD